MELLILVAALAGGAIAFRASRSFWKSKGHSRLATGIGGVGAALSAFVFIFIAGLELFPSEQVKQQRAEQQKQEEEQAQAAAAAEEAEQRAADMASDRSSQAWIYCKNEVRETLLAPSTADFPTFDGRTWRLDDQRYVVKSYVDSQNAFGAMLRKNWRCEARYLGGGTMDRRSWALIKIEME